MSSSLMVGISGIRGIIGDSLVPEVVLRYIPPLVNLLREERKRRGIDNDSNLEVILGRDSRTSGEYLQLLTTSILMSLSVNVKLIGIVPTPTVQLMVMEEKADAGIVITSSHNPEVWNGLKFIAHTGLFLNGSHWEFIKKLVNPGYSGHLKLGHQIVPKYDANEIHIQKIKSLPFLDFQKIATLKLRVVLDTINGAGGAIMSSLLRQAGCEVIGLNLEPTGIFAHKPEPIPENMKQLSDAVKEHKAHFGVAVDPDVDRCVFINEFGEPVGEEYTLAFAVDFILGDCGRRGPVVKNLSSSRAIDDIAKRYGVPVYATPVGEIMVADKMIQVGAVIGGEGNGGVMLPDIHIGRDAPVGCALVLQKLANLGSTSLSELKQKFPIYQIEKLKADLNGLEPDLVLEKLHTDWKSKTVVDTQDGLHLSTPNWWVHLRKSNTEPIVRVIGEYCSSSPDPNEGFEPTSLGLCTYFLHQIVSFKSK